MLLNLIFFVRKYVNTCCDALYLYSALGFLELFPVCLARLAKDPGVDQVSHHGPETCRGLVRVTFM